LLEPVEGHFDWSSVDGLLRQARANDLKLVFLWFGAWKNSMSTYVPAWVKRDQEKFPRAQLANGQGLDILSVFSAATREADTRAFSALMGHLKQVDGERNTVVMVQVENEIGMLPVAREYGSSANESFRSEVPDELVRRLAAPGPDPATGLRPPLAGLDSVWEGSFDAHGVWVPGRLLNGDQTHQGRHVRLAPGDFQIQRVRLYRYR
jgi:beta-galactosidase GanA